MHIFLPRNKFEENELFSWIVAGVDAQELCLDGHQ